MLIFNVIIIILSFKAFISSLQDAEVRVGQTITLSCEADTEANATWMKGDQILQNSSRITITKTGTSFTLKICNATEQDSGQYTIRLSKNHGEISHSAIINVLRGEYLILHGLKYIYDFKEISIVFLCLLSCSSAYMPFHVKRKLRLGIVA